jgi:hypothetical protein
MIKTMENAMTETSFTVALGTYAQALALVGTRGPHVIADVRIDAGMVRGFCGMVEDANPAYWRTESPVAPPATLLSWLLPLPWSPDGPTSMQTFPVTVPLPGSQVINVEHTAAYVRPLTFGLLLAMQEELVSVSPAKQTSLGEGHFVRTLMRCTCADTGIAIATIDNVALRYEPRAATT